MEGFEYGYSFGSYSECVRKAAYPRASFTREDCRLFEEHWEYFDEVLLRSKYGIPEPWEGGPPYRHQHPLSVNLGDYSVQGRGSRYLGRAVSARLSRTWTGWRNG